MVTTSHRDSRLHVRIHEGGATLADIAVFVAAAAALLYGAGLAYARFQSATPFEFFAADAFYYLNVARRSEALAFFSYDGMHATNGFHPLWQWLLSGMFRVLHLTEASDQQLLLDYFVCSVLAAVGFGFLALATCRLIGVRSLALVLTIPGCLELLLARLMTSTTDRPESAPWLIVNGMETSLSVFWFGIVVWLLLRRPSLIQWSVPRLVAISGLFTLIVLTRLDDVFLLAAFVGAVVWLARSQRAHWKTFLAVAALPAVSVLAYLFYNVATTDMLLPVSSSIKRDPGAWAGNLRDFLQLLFPTSLLNDHLYTWWWDALSWRSLQLVAPMFVSTVFLGYCALFTESGSAIQERDHIRRVLVILAAYVLMKGGYNLLFVPLLAQGHWYFPLSMASANLMLAFLIGRFLTWRRPDLALEAAPRSQRILRYLGVLGTAVGIGLALVSYRTSHLVLAIAGVAAPSLLLVLLANRIVESATKLSNHTWRQMAGGVGALAATGFVLMYANAIVNQKLTTDYGDASFEFWKSRHQIADALYRYSPSAKLFELDDGIMAYALTLPAMSGFGLATDAAAYAACRAQRCIDVAYERGYRLASSVQYWGYLYEQQRGFVRPAGERAIVESLVGDKALEPTPGADHYNFRLAFSFETGKYVVHFLEFWPRRGSTALSPDASKSGSY